jgi:glycosyltransferase involved in cell wall biosynthesis
VAPFCARHSDEEISVAYRAAGLDPVETPRASALGLPRPLLYEAWHRVGRPKLPLGRAALADVDLVHAPSPAVPPASGRPLVVTIHDVAFELFPDAYPRRGRRFHQLGLAAAARRADLVITVSQSAAEEILMECPRLEDRLRVVHNGVDHELARVADVAAVREHFGIGDAPYVLWVGSLEPRKGLGTLISAFARLASTKEAPPHQLVLVGPDGWLSAQGIDQADLAVVGDRLRSLGPVGEIELRSLYAGAELFAFPSRHEGFGIPVLEAMVQSTPVLCSDIPALREVTGDAARLLPVGDVEAWSTGLVELLGDERARSELARRGVERAAGFSWERTVAATREVYVEALGR